MEVVDKDLKSTIGSLEMLPFDAFFFLQADIEAFVNFFLWKWLRKWKENCLTLFREGENVS